MAQRSIDEVVGCLSFNDLNILNLLHDTFLHVHVLHPPFWLALIHYNQDKRLQQLGLKLQKPVAPVANYVAWRKSGDVVYISGQIPKELAKGIG